MITKVLEKVGSINGFTINKVKEIKFHYGKTLEGGKIVDRKVIETITELGFEDETFSLFCKNLSSYSILRSYLTFSVRAIGIVQDEDEDDGNMYVILVFPKGNATKIAYTGSDIKWIEDYKVFDPNKNIDTEAWRWLTVNSKQSTNKKCWSVIDWFLKR